ncbi:MAG: hypothetical protein ABSG90_10510 [Dehalococcoidia bacterium]
MKKDLMEKTTALSKTGGGSEKHFKAEAFDKLQFLLEEYRYNDHQVHCVVSLDGKLDRDVLKKAVLLTMEDVPILGCRFVEDSRRPYWQCIDRADYEKAFLFIESNDTDEDLKRLLVSRTAALEGPQVQVTLLRGPQHDLLNVVINHMVSDAAGFKQYMYLLASTYTSLMRDPHYRPASNVGGSRSVCQIFNQLNLIDRARLLFLPGNMKDSGYVLGNGGNGEGGLRPYMQLGRLERPGYLLLKKYCADKHFTVNDVVLAAYYRALYRLLEIKRDVPLNISCTVDLRRYLPGKKAQAICNLSSFILCDIIPGEAEAFDDTAGRVHEVMEARKRHFPGLGGLMTLPLVFQLFPYARAKKLIRENMHYPLFAMTNLDRIDKNLLIFGGTPVADAFMTGSIKYPAHFQMGFSTFNDTITFSLNLSDSKQDRELINRFFVLFNEELMEGINASKDNGLLFPSELPLLKEDVKFYALATS